MTWVVPYLRSDSLPGGAPAEPEREGPRLSLGLTLILLIVAGTASAFVSDWFVNGLEPAIVILHISQAFAGLVIVAIAGNAVENTAGLVLACKRPLGPRDLGRQKLRRADRRVPVPRCSCSCPSR